MFNLSAALPIEKKHIEHFSNFELIAHQIVEGFLTGLHKSPFHGFSVEFAEHKLFNQGDSVKNIDWKLFARTDKLFLKEYEEETNLKCTIALDLSSSMEFPESNNTEVAHLNKKGFSIYAAAALLNLLSKQRDAAGLISFSNELTFKSELKGSKTHYHFLNELLSTYLKEPLNKNISTSASDVIHQIAERIPNRSLFILFTDFQFQDNDSLNQITDSLHHLKHNNHEVLVFHVMDLEKEVKFNFSNRPHQFIDNETGRVLKINPQEIKAEVEAEQNKNINFIRNKLNSVKIDYVLADINEGFSKILQTYLIKRSKLF